MKILLLRSINTSWHLCEGGAAQHGLTGPVWGPLFCSCIEASLLAIHGYILSCKCTSPLGMPAIQEAGPPGRLLSCHSWAQEWVPLPGHGAHLTVPHTCPAHLSETISPQGVLMAGKPACPFPTPHPPRCPGMGGPPQCAGQSGLLPGFLKLLVERILLWQQLSSYFLKNKTSHKKGCQSEVFM